jgi:acyl carrier protein
VMTRKEMLLALDELLERPAGSLQGEESLSSLGSWDSVALVGYIAMVDERLDARVTGKQILACKTVDDLIALVGEKIQG